MNEKNRADLILHPVRIRITAALSLREASPKELAERLGDVPVSSLYRHLKLLLDGDIIEVAKTERVGSAEEKTYRLKASQTFSLEDMTHWTAEDYESYFRAAVLSIIASMKRYLSLEPDLVEVKRRALWQGHTLSVSEADWQTALEKIHTILDSLETTDDAPKTRELYLISHPLKEET